MKILIELIGLLTAAGISMTGIFVGSEYLHLNELDLFYCVLASTCVGFMCYKSIVLGHS